MSKKGIKVIDCRYKTENDKVKNFLGLGFKKEGNLYFLCYPGGKEIADFVFIGSSGTKDANIVLNKLPDFLSGVSFRIGSVGFVVVEVLENGILDVAVRSVPVKGVVRVGDKLKRLAPYKVGILTVSDRASCGKREDLSGKMLIEAVKLITSDDEIYYGLVPDDIEDIKDVLVEWSDKKRLDLILTTGGTGFSLRDNTPEATASVIEKKACNLSSLMRFLGFNKSPMSFLSRGIAGIRGKTIIINLPGSLNGAIDSFILALNQIEHALEIITGREGDCGFKKD